MANHLIDISGQRFGRLTAIRFSHRDGKRSLWLCQCDCGHQGLHASADLRRGFSRSCGCLRSEVVSRRARKAATSPSERGAWKKYHREYQTWASMLQRGNNPNSKDYHRYGAVGRVVCDRWRFGEGGLSGFDCFYADMGSRPEGRMSIDRIDNSKGYSPDNCRWATYAEQAANKG